mgnify:CR=1 FL=1
MIFDSFIKPDKRTGLSILNRLGRSAALLNPVNPNVANYLAMMDDRSKQNIAQETRNTTIKTLQQKAEQGDALAARFLSGIQSGALNPQQGMSGYFNALQSQDQFNRTQSAAKEKTQMALDLQKQQAENVATYLKGTGNDELAAMVMANPALAGEVMGDLAALKMKPTTGGYSKEQMSAMQALRGDVRKDTKLYKEISEGYDGIEAFYNNRGAVSDYALAVAFAKILDPGSVAREGEVAAVQNAGAKLPALKQALENAVTNKGKLPPEIREEIARLAREKLTAILPQAQETLDRYQATADKLGIDFEDIYYGPMFEEPDAVVPQKIPENVAQLGITQDDWELMTLDEKREFLEM